MIIPIQEKQEGTHTKYFVILEESQDNYAAGQWEVLESGRRRKENQTSETKECRYVRNWLIEKNIDSQCYLQIMQLCQRLEQILKNLRLAFSREATFQWFIL